METTKNYRGFEIKIQHDDSPQNPFKEWDCNLPLAREYDRDKEDYSNGDIGTYLSEVLSDNQIIRHQKVLAEILEIDLEYMKTYEFGVDQKIGDIRSEIDSSTDFYAWEKVCELSKTPYLHTCSRGYSQGDYANIFTCYTKEFERVCGVAKKDVSLDSLQANADLWGDWAWGNVYGYVISADNGLDDSCWGFYGDIETSGLLDEAQGVIDHHITERQLARVEKIKALIKAQVPFIYRTQILNTI